MTTELEQIVYEFFICQKSIDEINIDAINMLNILAELSIEEIVDIIESNSDELAQVNSSNIPQFSSIDDLRKTLWILCESQKAWTYESLGKRLCATFNPNGKIGAYRKYGENHYKLAVQLGLANSGHELKATELGMAYYLADNNEKDRNAILARLALKVPVIQSILIEAKTNKVDILKHLQNYLALSTATRRRSNVRKLLAFIREYAETGVLHRFDNIE